MINNSMPSPLTPLTSSTEKNKSYVISSFVETKGETMIAKSGVEFVEYPSRLKPGCENYKKKKKVPKTDKNVLAHRDTERNHIKLHFLNDLYQI